MKSQKYMSKDGFNTAVWGPPLWHVIRCISFNFPPEPSLEQKLQYAQFMLSLGQVLPCGACRDNYINNLASSGFDLDVFKNRDTFSRFIYKLETNVNKMITGKKALPKTFPEMRSQYECFRAKCHTSDNKKKEAGCVKPKGYVKPRAFVHIVPAEEHSDLSSLQVSKKCTTKQNKQ